MPTETSIPTARVTLSDVARVAQVSLATADRVLNGRPGVHARSILRVTEAVSQLRYRPDPSAARLSRVQPHRVCFVLPSGCNSFVQMLREQVRENASWMTDHRVSSRMLEVDVFEPQRLAQLLSGLAGQCETVVVLAVDHPVVEQAIHRLMDLGCEVITLVSDVPKSRRRHFVGIDNVAAGRTAGSLIGRFAGPAAGEIGVIVGSLSLRDHAERSFGFNQVLSGEYPHLTVLPPVAGKDLSELNQTLTRKLLANHPKLRGIYSVGAGNPGISAALQETARAHDVLFVGHELTPEARADLLDGTMDAVISQDAGHEIRSALRLALSHTTREPVDADRERIHIAIYLKDNLL